MDPLLMIPVVPFLFVAGIYIRAMIQGATDELEQLPLEQRPLPLVPKSMMEVQSLAAPEFQKEIESRKAHSISLPKETSALLGKASKRVGEALDYFTEVDPKGEEVRELKALEARLMENVDALRKSVPFGQTRAPAEEEALFAENIRIINDSTYRLVAGDVAVGKKGLRVLNRYLRSKENLAIAATEVEATLTKESTPREALRPWWQPKRAISSR